mgnify:CR=1 FL=1
MNRSWLETPVTSITPFLKVDLTECSVPRIFHDSVFSVHT